MLVIERGDYAIVRPIAKDPIAALQGVHAGSGPTSEQARKAERQADVEREDRRRGRDR